MPRLRPAGSGLVTALVLLGASAPRAQAAEIIVAASGEQTDLQDAVDQAASLSEPAVIVLPPGAWELFGTVTIEVDHLTVLGAGPDKTLLFRDHEDAAPFLRVQNAQGVRVSGIGLRGSQNPASDTLEVGIRVSDAVDFRIDHCQFGYLGNSGIMTQGDTRGVIDHSSFDDIFKDPIGNYGYGVSIYGVGLMEDEPFGSPRATFIEDSILAGCRHATASNNGARYVLRYSRVTANEFSHAIDAHGDEYNSTDAGTEWIDVHHVLVNDPVYVNNAVRIRGGKGLIWSNEIIGYNVAVNLTENTPQQTGPVHVWDNTLSAGTTPVSSGAGSEAVMAAPPGYEPYRYPHPLVDDLVAAAGPDGRYLVDPATNVAQVYLDARASTAAEGVLEATRWRQGDQLLSNCAVDVRPLPPGQHLIVLEVERSDGLVEHDLAVIDVAEAAQSGSLTSTPSWANAWFVPVVGQAAVELDVTPAASAMDGYVALTGRWPVNAHDANAAIVRMNNQGFFDVHNGTGYASDQVIPYQAGQTYHLRMDLDVAAQTYDVTVDGALLASGYSFRVPAGSIGQAVAWHSTGGITAAGIAIQGEQAQPDPPCAPDGGVPEGGADAQVPDADGSTVPSDDGGDGSSVLPDGGSVPPDGDKVPSGGAAGSDTTDDGCGCRTVGAPSRYPALLLLFACVLTLRRRGMSPFVRFRGR
jgi:hypothetical protein